MDLELTEQQNKALEAMKNGLNVFLTGPAGTGKSLLLKYYIFWYQVHRETKTSKIYITSTTGLSALLINGMTINRYAGIGIADKDVETYYKRIIKKKNLKDRWINTKVLIIDEISMMDPDTFDKIDSLARKVRRCNRPFGGIQVILSGDFLQIPPVNSENYCFESFSWNNIDKTFYFDQILRQNNNELQEVLNKIRVGIIDNDVKYLLDKCLNKELIIEDGIEPTLLFSRKNMVVQYNDKELKKLIENNKEYHKFIATYEFYENNVKMESFHEEAFYTDLLNSQYQVDNEIIFSLHSQVMLTVNMPDYNLANGSRGIIIDFTKDDFHYPIVLFSNKEILTVKEHDFKIDENNVIAIKKQLPLILSWAITIHKAQGMTLDYIKTDIGSSIFEYGQAYVVLSRIKNLEGLSIMNIDYSKIKAHPKILKYYEELK